MLKIHSSTTRHQAVVMKKCADAAYSKLNRIYSKMNVKQQK